MKRPSLPTLRRLIRNSSCTTCSSLRWASVGAVLLACQIPGKASAQTVYTYAGTNTTARNWSTPTTWTTVSGPGTTYPGSDGSTTGDTADIENPATTTNLTYDTGASGYVGTLNMFNSANNNTTFLTLAQNLTINTGGSIYSSFGGNNVEVINLGNFTLAIGSGANLTLGSATATTLGTGGSNPSPITTTGTGGLAINGTLTVATPVASFYETINAPVTLNGGTVTLNEASSTATSRLIFAGNFTSSGTSTLQATGSNTAGATIYFEGGSTTIGALAAPVSPAIMPAVIFADAASTTTTQNTSLGALLSNATISSSNAVGTAGAPITSTKIFSSSTMSVGVTNAIDSIRILNQKGYSSLVFTLGSNLNLAASQTSAFTFSLTGGAGTQGNIDLAGFAYNVAASTSTLGFAPAASTSAGTTQINILNSGASSISGGTGIFQAAYIALNTSDIGIGSGVILQASGGTATVNNLGVVANGVTTISPTSTFYYTGAGTAASPATLTSGRTIGALTVGNGTAASNLQLATANLTTAGDVTIAGSSTLQLGGRTLTLSAGNLTGTGTVSGTTANVASTGNAVTFTGTGGVVPATNGTVGMLTLAATQTLTLGANSTSLFDIASASSFDQLILNGSNVTVAYNGTLALNFLNGYAPTSGTFQIASADTLAGGNFSSITSNVSGDTFSFNSATGVLSITAVPEPATAVQAGMMLVLAFGAGVFKRIRRRAGGSC